MLIHLLLLLLYSDRITSHHFTPPHLLASDFLRGHLCKHILFVLLKVLRVPPSSPLVFQKALLQEELLSIFQQAPMQVTKAVSAKACVTKVYRQTVLGQKEEGEDGEGEKEEEEEKKEEEELPLEGDCAVCFDAMLSRADVTACPTCRNSLHSQCLQQWLKHSPTCVYCRAPLTTPTFSSSSSPSSREGGYVNLGSMQGLSSTRDASSYRSYSHYSQY
jgi:hypothetical protein